MSKDQVNQILHSKTLKFTVIVYLEIASLWLTLRENKSLATSFAELKHYGDNHNYWIRWKTKSLLDTRHFITDIYGT